MFGKIRDTILVIFLVAWLFCAIQTFAHVVKGEKIEWDVVAKTTVGGLSVILGLITVVVQDKLIEWGQRFLGPVTGKAAGILVTLILVWLLLF